MTASSSPSASSSRSRRTYAAGAVLVAAATTAVLVLLPGGSDSRGGGARGSAAAGSASAVPAPADEGLLALARRDASDALAVGRADAPVVMIEYSDFQCPFCGRFARETKPELLRSYVDEGILRIEWRNFPVFGEESQRAALAGWAAGRQDRFWEFHDVVYGESRERNSGAFSTDRLVAMAREAGVADIDRFRSDMSSEEAREAVARDRDEGYGLGVSSTPAFLVNGEPILGAQPTDAFRSAVEAAARAVEE
ncbi:DsbA family protein [Streptomyces griseomycini]|uniref:Protein-disulfide isomerase n=1 Tax=Streptomyces griseomycini TaxID=66895 RepID=A0A7W7PUI8_9ACTN|nr:thioredoxin domain-containing protein [Streptomyces griseomycini]MBB4901537.1 protein-disulfide isomerase [Streptomyces griseomycini]GGQ21706.1 hypothetical protein GCM10010266_51000 [Streptomyces griseomycini]GGR53047.1 hypothetical protein GCM10015536_68130 [Streptomyces griseomycini]